MPRGQRDGQHVIEGSLHSRSWETPDNTGHFFSQSRSEKARAAWRRREKTRIPQPGAPAGDRGDGRDSDSRHPPPGTPFCHPGNSAFRNVARNGGRGKGGRPGTILTGARLQGQGQDQRADHQVQAVEGPFPVAIVLVGVHNWDGEQQQELHGQLSSGPRQTEVTREARVPAGCAKAWAGPG